MNIDFDDEKQQESTPNTHDNSPTTNNTPPQPVSNQITRPRSVDNLSKEEKELLVPAELKTNYTIRHQYDPNIMQAIIIDIATTDDKIEDIVAKYGQSKSAVYLWRSLSRPLMDSWRAAMKHRTHIKAADFESEVAILDAQVENDDDYKRTSNRIRRFDRVWGHREWFMSRHNRQDYGDKVENDIHLDISPAKLRDEAYLSHNGGSSPVDAEYEDITVPSTLNQADIDTGQSQ